MYITKINQRSKETSKWEPPPPSSSQNKLQKFTPREVSICGDNNLWQKQLQKAKNYKGMIENLFKKQYGKPRNIGSINKSKKWVSSSKY